MLSSDYKRLVTGANGLIGSHLIKILLENNRQVVAFVKPNTSIDSIAKYKEDIQIFYGDVRDGEAVSRAMEGCRKVYHLAACCLLWEKHSLVYENVNVDGTRNIMRAAKQHNVKRVVYTSTCDLIVNGQRNNGELCTEDDFVQREEDCAGPYGRSKFLAEQVARSYSEGIEIIVVHPSCPIGRNDTLPTEPGRLIERVLTRKLIGYIPTQMNFVHVEDCAKGHFLAMERGEAGERYILSGKNISLENFLRKISEIANVEMPRIKVPYALGIAFAHVLEAFARINHSSPIASIEGTRLVKHPFVFSHAKATQELGYSSRDIESTIKEAVEWHFERANNTLRH